MEEFFIHVKAPFAAFRYFQAGNYRVTMPTMPHSVAYGLILNLAGVQMRRALDEENTLIKDVNSDFNFEEKDSIPNFEIAIGEIKNSKKGSVFQQLHDFPPHPKKIQVIRAKGTKPRILPIRREFLIDLDVIIGVRSTISGLMINILNGINGSTQSRYGLPFAGDNNFQIDFLEIYESAVNPVSWYYPVPSDEIPETETVRLTVGIDRLDNSKTVAPLFAITKEKSNTPPPNAWVWTPK